MRRPRVLLAEDHRLLREAFVKLLEPGCDVVGAVADGRALLAAAPELRPDIVVVDIAMPLLNGLEATRQIKRDHPEINVLVLTMHDNEEYVRQVLGAGASGYVLKRAAASELVSAIRTVHHGEAVLSPSITRVLIEDYLRQEGTQPEPASDGLTPREREVLQLIAEGHTSKKIAEVLGLSVKTVQAHRTSLMQKLNVHDRGDLIKYAIQKKIIEV